MALGWPTLPWSPWPSRSLTSTCPSPTRLTRRGRMCRSPGRTCWRSVKQSLPVHAFAAGIHCLQGGWACVLVKSDASQIPGTACRCICVAISLELRLGQNVPYYTLHILYYICTGVAQQLSETIARHQLTSEPGILDALLSCMPGQACTTSLVC